ncbi:MAG: MBOAT family protein [Bacteroides sp.]|nr:MBOAT family protein [Bacteroides sp.]
MSDSIFSIEKLIDVLKFDQNNPLLFNSGLFLILFAIFIVIYQLIRKHRTAKFLVVIAFSLYFYYKSSAEYCFILLGVCISDYLLGIWLERCRRNWKRRSIVALNVIINIGMLFYFKYFNLIYETFANITATDFEPLNIILPAGISFFTFRSISYIVDIYRREIPACHDFLSYTFFLTFFPPLLAGPVVRAKDMLPQIEANPVASKAMVSEGLFLIMCGLIKKVVVADFISGNFVDRIFDNPALYSGFEVVMGAYGFIIQLYCDFSGYSDMAIGIAMLMGYQFVDNFRSPFKSQSPTEFWHRWHISLSTWLRDYLYIPLGGNRCGKVRHHANLMTTMVIGGLWHGASWMFLIWGALQGAFLTGHKLMAGMIPQKLRNPRPARLWKALSIFLTFNLIAFSFVFFRADSMGKIQDMWVAVSENFHLSVAPQFIEGYLAIVLVMVGAYIMHFAPERWTSKLKSAFHKSHLIIQAIVLAIVIFIVIQMRQSDIMPFIYFQY